MQKVQEIQVEPTVMTITGSLTIEELRKFDVILPHEHLIQNLTKYYTGEKGNIDKIELYNYSAIKEKPYSNLFNLGLNDQEEICTELKQAFGDKKVEPTNVDNGRDIKKLLEIAKRNKIDVVIGVKPYIKGQLYADEEKNKVFVNVEKFSTEMDEELFDEKYPTKSGFVGELYVEEELFTPHNKVIFETCIKEAVKYNSPLYLECTNISTMDVLEKTLSFIWNIEKQISKLVLWNLPLDIHKENTQGSNDLVLLTKFKNQNRFKELINKGIYIGFDATNYSLDLFELAWFIKWLIDQNLQNNILISTGVKYKVHLEKYGGHGYNLFSRLIENLIQIGVKEESLNQILKENPLRILNWWVPLKPKEIYIKFWKCEFCGKEAEESVQRFAKEGHDFCTAKCMRSFKY